MKPFRSSGGKTYKLPLPDGKGGRVDRTTGTRDRGTANAMARAVASLRERKRYAPLYEALLLKRLEVEEVWLACERGEADLDALLARLTDVDVEPLVDEWHKALGGKVADDTRDHYRAAVRSLVRKGSSYPRSFLTVDRLQTWVDDMDAAPGTVLKRGRGMARFTSWLKKPKGLLVSDPMLEVELPPPGKPRDLHLTTEEAIRLADAQPGQYRILSALLAGTGMDVSTALKLTRRDVDAKAREIRAAGTKTHNRDRIVRVAEWAWPYLEPLLRGKLPGARLFDEIPDRWRARDVHREATVALEKEDAIFSGYWMRDARHTWAVRAVRSGMPLEMVAQQLGHKDATLVLKVYGRYRPNKEERDRWERIATERDKAMEVAR